MKQAEIVELRRTLVEYLHKATGLSKETIEQDMRQGKLFTSQEAIDYGLIDRLTP